MKKIIGLICFLIGIIWFGFSLYLSFDLFLTVLSQFGGPTFKALALNLLSSFTIPLIFPLLLIVVSSIAMSDTKIKKEKQ